FYLSFDLTEDYYYDGAGYLDDIPSSRLMSTFVAFIIGAAILSILSWLVVRKEKFRLFEFIGTIATIFLVVLSAQYYVDGTLYSILFNLLIFAICIGLIYTGYEREDIKVVNLGVFWICALIIV